MLCSAIRQICSLLLIVGEVSSCFLGRQDSTNIMVAWEDKCHNHKLFLIPYYSLFLPYSYLIPPFPELSLLTQIHWSLLPVFPFDYWDNYCSCGFGICPSHAVFRCRGPLSRALERVFRSFLKVFPQNCHHLGWWAQRCPLQPHTATMWAQITHTALCKYIVLCRKIISKPSYQHHHASKHQSGHCFQEGLWHWEGQNQTDSKYKALLHTSSSGSVQWPFWSDC